MVHDQIGVACFLELMVDGVFNIGCSVVRWICEIINLMSFTKHTLFLVCEYFVHNLC